MFLLLPVMRNISAHHPNVYLVNSRDARAKKQVSRLADSGFFDQKNLTTFSWGKKASVNS